MEDLEVVVGVGVAHGEVALVVIVGKLKAEPQCEEIIHLLQAELPPLLPSSTPLLPSSALSLSLSHLPILVELPHIRLVRDALPHSVPSLPRPPLLLQSRQRRRIASLRPRASRAAAASRPCTCEMVRRGRGGRRRYRLSGLMKFSKERV